MLKLHTPAGEITWETGRVWGNARALLAIHSPRPGAFGLVPDQVDYSDALERPDSFQHLVMTIWPEATVLEDTEPEEEFDPDVLY
ncbi:MAG: hypothetical protein U0931_05005 [Vulcanimicrobiota bacterium]